MSTQVAEIEDLETRNRLTDIAIQALLKDIEFIEKKGQKGSPYYNFIVRELDALGYDRDYSPTDTGNDYE